jgi:hypothetical protein
MARRFEMVKPDDTLVSSRSGYEGFSWTVFFFGPIPMLCRGDFGIAAIVLVVGIIIGIPTFAVGSWIVWLIAAFVYNKMHMRKLEDAGFRKATLVLQQHKQEEQFREIRREPQFSHPVRNQASIQKSADNGVGPGLR